MSTVTPSPELLALVNDFLASNGFEKAAKAVQKQAEAKGLALPKDTKTTLTALFDARPKEAATPATADDSSDASESSDSSDSDSESESEKKTPKKDASKKRKVTPPSSSSSDSSNSSGDEKPAAKKTKTIKKADTSSDSSSASSSSESEDSSDSSDSSDSDSSDSDSDSDSDSSSSSSSSDSDSSSSSDSDSSDSDSDSESESEKKPAKVAKVEKPAKKEKADKKEKKDKKPTAEAKSSSSSAASSVTLADAPAPVDTIMVPASSAIGQAEGTAAPSNDAEEHMHPSRKRKLGYGEAEQQVAVPATEENIKRAKKENVPFSRIPKDQWVDPRLASNAFVPYDYAQKAHESLIVTKGKAFTKAKNKGKRGSYRGGVIDQTPKGIQFED
ncbi:hypothetical protein E4T42_07172 [Aureobasidium subglaciale]|uniref:Srp40 C-terminal domain-containing protein n=1 Tax=Aureobasidium subglaciale (strain EXF-2481) TaxID=1043005 RepID=A0A074YSS4_AURSE|nr:uncharacterized protein AUEXF2481DRAFT_155791 [Aureobasidium subglaciale EXF-2481]KAI5210360.1 hypothetical protein E4T38_02052 [Aureobasidium subglaciale]KAI5229013.1 hypothetical protein E4T40_01842 [Aureobasidium subglaciale]KAI5232815.1 hypothetical protein E4T41_02062 [Aureobasidium subglaciale]KAI5244231.1 hypothetical protein E4T42_07172 [Aureobasidium subglaciale]KAI5265969.1 hypothetical protein E4T46_01829 [Aureobasidium subglaciale]